MKTITKLWIFIALLALITPLGLIIPRYFKAGAAWGELPAARNVPMPDYCASWGTCCYIISAIAGVLLAAGIIFLIGKFLTKKD